MTVSLVIPTFNRTGLLVELLDSIRAQAWRPVEVIVVDDASTDNTEQAVRTFAARCSRAEGIDVRYVRQAARRGAPAARNRGISVASGGGLMFVDSDDTLAPAGLIDLATHLFQSDSYNYVYGRVILTDGRLKALPKIAPVGAPFSMDAAVDVAGYHWHTMGALYRRSCIDRIGPWNEALTGSQDWEYQARVKLSGDRGEFVDTLVGYWRQHDSGRVGARRFRPDYVDSVMKACASILEQARAAGKCHERLKCKLAKRLVVHALEWGANGHRRERQRCLHQALHTAPGAFLLSTAIRLYALCPSAFDRAALRVVHRLQQRA
jgi:glycosyltransferase involved in cell wall biosynthesis